MMKPFVSSAIIASLFFFSACGKSPTLATNTQSSTQAPVSPLLGSWKLDCSLVGNDPTAPTPSNSTYTILSVEKDGTYQELVYQFHGSDHCDEAMAYSRQEFYGTIKVNATAITQRGLQTYLLAPLSTQAANDYSTQSECSHSTWTVNQTQSCDVPKTAESDQSDSLYTIDRDTLSIKTCDRNRSGPPNCTTYQYQRLTE